MLHVFGDFELDVPAMELRRAGTPVAVEPQVFDVLAHLVAHHERVVLRHELLDVVWGHRFVTEATLSSRIMAARRAVGDSGAEQRVIRTVRGRGFRFVADVRTEGAAPPRPAAMAEVPSEPGGPAPRAPSGREAEVADLERLAGEGFAGRRRLVLVTGPPGIGKSALLDRLLAGPAVPGEALVLRGRCLDRRGPSEPYMAVLEALAAACGAPGGEWLAAELAWRAPSWVAQMPWLLRLEEVTDVEPDPGVTPERMLREIVEAFEAIGRVRPVVVAVEDLHWSGPSTLDMLATLARRDGGGRLLLLATARHGGDDLRAVQRALRAEGRCVEVVLPPLEGPAVARFLVERLGPPAGALAAPLQARTGGNPLFMHRIVDWWVERGLVPAPGEPWRPVDVAALSQGVPDTLRDLVEDLVGRLDPSDRLTVESAAIAGAEASAALVAAGAGLSDDEAEGRLDGLARTTGIVREAGAEEWPDGTVAGRFALVHDVYGEVIEAGVPAGRRARAHGLMADRLEQAFGADAQERSAELAAHLLAAHEALRAVPYVRRTAERALARAAHREALVLLDRALAALSALAPSTERDAAELTLQAPRGIALIATRGWGDPDTLAAFRHARALVVEHAEPADVAAVLYGLALVHEFRGEYVESTAVLEERLALPGPELRSESLELLACSSFHRGRLAESVAQAYEGIREAAGSRPSVLLAAFGENAHVACHLWAARATCLMGRPEHALVEAEQAVALARAHTYEMATGLLQLAFVRQQRGEPEAALTPAEEAAAVAGACGYPYQASVARIIAGWARALLGDPRRGREEVMTGIAGHAATGAVMDRPHFLGLLAEAHLAEDDPAGAEVVLDEALADLSAEHTFFFAAELHRLRAVALRRQGREDAARLALVRGRDIARSQGATTLELRIALEAADAAEVAKVLARVEEGAGIPDVARAHALLGAPGRDPWSRRPQSAST